MLFLEILRAIINDRLTVNGKQIVNGDQSVSGNQAIGGKLSVSSLSGSGTEMIGAKSDGTLVRSSVSMGQVETAVKKTIPKLESAARGLGRAVESSGAIAAAMSAVPEVTLDEDESIRCGVGTGGFGSQYAVSAGCALRVGEKLHLNGAMSYTPSVDYEYGKTPSIAGRLGFSFPLGRIAKATSSESDTTAQSEVPSDVQVYLAKMETNIEPLQVDVELKDERIDALKATLDALMNEESYGQRLDNSQALESKSSLIATLKERIKKLEEDEKVRDGELRSRLDKVKQENATIRKENKELLARLERLEAIALRQDSSVTKVSLK